MYLQIIFLKIVKNIKSKNSLQMQLNQLYPWFNYLFTKKEKVQKQIHEKVQEKVHKQIHEKVQEKVQKQIHEMVQEKVQKQIHGKVQEKVQKQIHEKVQEKVPRPHIVHKIVFVTFIIPSPSLFLLLRDLRVSSPHQIGQFII